MGLVKILGDTNGNSPVFEESLQALGIVDLEGRRVPDDDTVISLGDNLGDRFTGSQRIAAILMGLRDQNPSRVVNVVGNHDTVASYFLGAEFSPEAQKVHDTDRFEFDNYFGLTEFMPAAAQAFPWIKDPTHAWTPKQIGAVKAWMRVELKKPGAVHSLREHAAPETIQYFIRAQIIHQIEDILFVHTSVTPNMIRALTFGGSNRIDEVNELYQEGIHDVLVRKQRPSEAYFSMLSTFSHPNNNALGNWNMEPTTNVHAKQLEAVLGVTRVIHGHSLARTNPYRIGGLQLASIDFKAGDDKTKPSAKPNGLNIALLDHALTLHLGEAAVRSYLEGR